MPEIKLSKRQSEAWHYLEDKETTEVGYGGAAGGGKSLLGCVWHIHRRMTYPETRGLIGRARFVSLKESTLVTFMKVMNMLGYKQGVHYKYNANTATCYWMNGSTSSFKDLQYQPSDPDYQRLGSTEYTDVFVDEFPEITLKCWEILSTRVRWKLNEYDLIPKMLGTCNPQAGWVKERFISDSQGNPVQLKDYQKFIHALVTDNPDKEWVAIYKEQLERMESDYDKRRLLYGDWDAQREVINQFAYQFDRERHVSDEAVFDPEKRLFISVDFNLSPFGCIFFHRWKDKDGVHFHIVDEFSIPNANIHEMGERIAEKYGPKLATCSLTGDAMGKQKQLSQRDNASYYTILRRALNLAPQQIQVKRNPKHSNSRADVNYFLLHFDDFKVNPSCTNTIRDLTYVECDAYGSIKKADRKNELQRADHLDCVRYAINTYEKDWIKEHMKNHNYVTIDNLITPETYKPSGEYLQ